jgi:6-phosphogluconolactonase
MMPEFLGFADRSLQAEALADCVAEKLDAAMRERGEARLIVPGGSTPVAFFESLSQRDLAWWRVHVSLTDDRQVPSDHPASNELLVREHLLQGKATKIIFDALETGAQAVADVLVIGMGEDGHMASLFPGAPELDEALDSAHDSRIVHIVPDPLPPHAPFPRISMTLTAMLTVRMIFVLISGRTKLAVYEQAMTARPTDMPVAALLQQSTVPITVYWAP